MDGVESKGNQVKGTNSRYGVSLPSCGVSALGKAFRRVGEREAGLKRH